MINVIIAIIVIGLVWQLATNWLLVNLMAAIGIILLLACAAFCIGARIRYRYIVILCLIGAGFLTAGVFKQKDELAVKEAAILKERAEIAKVAEAQQTKEANEKKGQIEREADFAASSNMYQLAEINGAVDHAYGSIAKLDPNEFRNVIVGNGKKCSAEVGRAYRERDKFSMERAVLSCVSIALRECAKYGTSECVELESKANTYQKLK